MSHRRVIRTLGLVAALGLVTGIGLPGAETAAAATVTCPTVNETTGAVTPAPSPGVDWSGCDLDNAIMSGADLGGANLSGASITGQSRQEELVGTNLTGANLSSAVMAGADMTGANLTDADLTDTNLLDAVLGGTTLTGANLTGADMANVESGSGHITGTPAALPAGWVVIDGFLFGPTTYLIGADLAGINLSGTDLVSATLASANLTGCDLTGADLSSASLPDADLADADLTSATVTGANLNSAQLGGADLSGTELSGANLDGVASGNITGTAASLPADWSQVAGYLIGPQASLTDADLADASLTTADLEDADLAGADLAGASLTTADLMGANLTGADLGGADLASASLTAAVLTGTDLAGADLAGATLARVRSGGITGTASSLPADWSVVAGYLIGPEDGLTDADLSGADLAGADLYDSLLEDANFTGANLSGADVSVVNATGANLTDANLSGGNLTGSYLTRDNVSGADLGSATLAGVLSGGLTGTPASLPADWSVLAGYLVGPGANLQAADLADQNLSGADLTGTRLLAANLTSTSLEGADLSDANLNYAVLDDASLLDADVAGATFTGAYWDNTTCPNGTNSNAYDDGCFSPLDTTAPAASPAVTAGTAGANGWYTSAVIVTWNWTDAGTIVTADCQQTSTTSGNGTITLQASCADLAGNVGHATYTVKVDTTRPAVSVTGVSSGAVYVTGKVPAAGCATTDAVSGVAADASLTLTTKGANGVGPYTATCSGAMSVAGGGQASPVTASYTVVYGFGGFSGLAPGTVIAKSAHTITARFRITDAAGKDIWVATTAAFAAEHAIEVRLTGPGIKPVTAACRWVASARSIECTIKIPGAVRLGRGNRYKITVEENVGTGFVRAPATGRASNPVTITFTS
jgi:uncharacterized protein YjbI with pentapeptide repeats